MSGLYGGYRFRALQQKIPIWLSQTHLMGLMIVVINYTYIMQIHFN